jgi:hypothetical protein
VPKTPLISIVEDDAEGTPMACGLSRFRGCEPNLARRGLRPGLREVWRPSPGDAPLDDVRGKGSKFILVVAAVALALVGSSCGPKTRAGGAAGLQGGNIEGGGTTGAGGEDSLGAGSKAAASCNPASAWSSSVETGLPPSPGSDPVFCP